MVSPEIDDNINIVIEDKDIRIDTYRYGKWCGWSARK